MSDLHRGFQQSDATANRNALFAFLDRVNGLPHIQAIKRRMADLLEPQAGQRVLDVGCGMGHELLKLADLVAPDGQVIGIDLNTHMVEEAGRRTAHLGDAVRCETGDAQEIPLDDAAVDGARAERVLMYIPDRERALSEIVRVVRPGGLIVAFELDYGATAIDAPDPTVAQNVLDVLATTVPHRWAGRSLSRLFHSAGLDDIVVEPFPVKLPYDVHQQLVGPALDAAVQDGRLDAAAYAHWWEASETANRFGHHSDTFFGMVVRGRKPK